LAKLADIKKRARRLANDGKIVDAIRALEEVTSQGHVDPYDLVMMGDLCIRGGRSEDATGYYERAVEAYSEASLHRNGIALCRKVLRVQPGQSTFLRLLAELCEREGLVLDAVSGYLEYAEGLDPDDDEVDRVWLDSLARLRPRNTEILTRQAEMLFRWGRAKDATSLLRAGAESVSRDEDRNTLLEMAGQMAAMAGEGTGDPEFDAEMSEFLDEKRDEPRLQRPQMEVNETSGEMNFRDITFNRIDEAEATGSAPDATAGEEPFVGPELPTEDDQEPEYPQALDFGDIDLSASDPEAPHAEAPEVDLHTSRVMAFDADAIDLDADEEADPAVEAELDLETAHRSSRAPGHDAEESEDDQGGVLEIDADDDYATALAELSALDQSRATSRPDLPPEPDHDDAEPSLAEASGDVTPGDIFARAFGDIQLDATDDEDDVVSEEGPSAGDSEDPDATREIDAGSLVRGEIAPEVREVLERAETPARARGRELPEDVATLQMHLLEDPFDRRVLTKLLEAHLHEGDILSAQDLRERLANVHLQAGDGASALQVYRDFLEVEPTHREMRARAARLARELGQPLEVPEGGADGPKRVDALFNVRGLSNVEVRDDVPPVSEDDMVDLGALLDEFRNGIRTSLQGADPRTHYDMGLSHLEMGLHEEAAEAFEQAAVDPNLEAESRELWGRALRLAGRPEESTRVLHAALALRPESLGVRYQLALSLEDAGEAEEAMRLHRSILREDPNFEDCRARTEALGGSDCTPRSPGTSG
jgi:tetratricopeptide (TPR) repeat protein